MMARKPPAEVDQSEVAPPETDAPALVRRHWLKYTGIGGRKQKQAGNSSGQGEDVTSLGSLEAEILGLLWEIGRAATSMEVMETSLYRRRAQGQEPASFATIATTLRRLTGKGLLSSQKNEARTPVYWPTVGREQMAARILNNVAQTLLGTSLHSLLPKLIGEYRSGRENAEEDVELQRLMKELEQIATADTMIAAGRDEEEPS